MKKLCEKIVKNLTKEKKTISFMESCTGGYLSNLITNIEGSSKVLKVGLVTYSNEYKIKFNVPKEIIDKYSVYSSETANEMAKAVSKFAKSDIGVGITGELSNNSSNIVYYAFFLKDDNIIIEKQIEAKGRTREAKKNFIAKHILVDILDKMK